MLGSLENAPSSFDVTEIGERSSLRVRNTKQSLVNITQMEEMCVNPGGSLTAMAVRRLESHLKVCVCSQNKLALPENCSKECLDLLIHSATVFMCHGWLFC